jgi:hypothetical protein
MKPCKCPLCEHVINEKDYDKSKFKKIMLKIKNYLVMESASSKPEKWHIGNNNIERRKK